MFLACTDSRFLAQWLHLRLCSFETHSILLLNLNDFQRQIIAHFEIPQRVVTRSLFLLFFEFTVLWIKLLIFYLHRKTILFWNVYDTEDKIRNILGWILNYRTTFEIKEAIIHSISNKSFPTQVVIKCANIMQNC